MDRLKVFVAALLTLQLLQVEATKYLGDRVSSRTANGPTVSRRWRGRTMMGRGVQDYAGDHDSSPPSVSFDSSLGKSKSSSSGLTGSQVGPQVRSRVLQGTRAGGGYRTRHFVSQYQNRKGKERLSLPAPGASRRVLPLAYHRNRTITRNTRANSSVDDQSSDEQKINHSSGLHNVMDSSGNPRLVKNSNKMKTKEHLGEAESSEYGIYTHNEGGYGDKEFPKVLDDAHDLDEKGLDETGRPTSLKGPSQGGSRAEKHNVDNIHDKNTQNPELEYVAEVRSGVDRSCLDSLLEGCSHKAAWRRPEGTSADVILPLRATGLNNKIYRAFSDHQDRVDNKSRSGQINGQASNDTSDHISTGRSTNKQEKSTLFDSTTSRKNRGTIVGSVNTIQGENTHAAATPVPPERDLDSVEVKNSSVILISIRGKWNESAVDPLSSRAAGNQSVIMESSEGPGYNGVNNEGVKFYKSFPFYSSAQSESSATDIINNADEPMISGQSQSIEENGYKQSIREYENFTSQWETQVHEPQLLDGLQYSKFNRNAHENRPKDDRFRQYKKTILMPDQDARKRSSLKEINAGTHNVASSSPAHQYFLLDPALMSHLPGVNLEVAGGDHIQSMDLETPEQDSLSLEWEDLQEGDPNRIKNQNPNLNFGSEKSSIYDSRASLGKDGVYHLEEGSVGLDVVSEKNERGIGLFSVGDESFFASFERFFQEHGLDAKTTTESGYEKTRYKGTPFRSFSDTASKQRGKEQSWNADFTSHPDHRSQQAEIKHQQLDLPQQSETPPQPHSSSPSPIFGSRLPPENFYSLNDGSFSPSSPVTSRESFSSDQIPQELQMHAESNPVQSFKPSNQFYVYPRTKFPAISVIPALVPHSMPPSDGFSPHITPALQPFSLKDAKYNQRENQDTLVQETRSFLQEYPYGHGDIQNPQQRFPAGVYLHFHETPERNLSNNDTSHILHQNQEGNHELSVPRLHTVTSPPVNNSSSLQSPVFYPTPQPTHPFVLHSSPPDAQLPYPPPPPPLPPPYTLSGKNRTQESQPQNPVTLVSASNRPDPPLHVMKEGGSGQSMAYVEAPMVQWQPSYLTKPYLQTSGNGSINAPTRPVNGKLSTPQENRAVRVNVDNRRPQGNQKGRTPILYEDIRRPSVGEGSRRPHSRLKNGRRVVQGKRPSRNQGPHDNRKPLNIQKNLSFAISRGNTHGQDTAGKKMKRSRPGRHHKIFVSPPDYHLKPPPSNSDNSKIPHREEIQEYRHNENINSANESLLHNENRKKQKHFQPSHNGEDLEGSHPTQTNEPMSSFQYLNLLPRLRPHQHSGPTRHTRGSPSPRQPSSSPSIPSPPPIPSLSKPSPSPQYTPLPRYNSFGLLFHRPPPRQPQHHETRKPPLPTFSHQISTNKPQTTSNQMRSPRPPNPHPGRDVLNIRPPPQNGSKSHNKNSPPVFKIESHESPGRGNLRFRPGKEIESEFRPLYEVSQPLPRIPASDESRMSESHAEMMKNMRYGLNGEPLNIWIPI